MISPRLLGIAGSLLAHTTVFAVGSVAFVRSAQFAVELGDGGVENSLFAAPIEILMQEEDLVMLAQNDIEEELIVAPVEDKKETAQTVKDTEKIGDGSSLVPGEDETTYQSSGGAVSEAKADYLRNPAPAYPWEARENGWEGVVVLRVTVSSEGDPTRIETEKSSGHDVLDESALKTVRQWRFRPAQAGDIPMESTVLVPVRFELKKGR